MARQPVHLSPVKADEANPTPHQVTNSSGLTPADGKCGPSPAVRPQIITLTSTDALNKFFHQTIKDRIDRSVVAAMLSMGGSHSHLAPEWIKVTYTLVNMHDKVLDIHHKRRYAANPPPTSTQGNVINNQTRIQKRKRSAQVYSDDDEDEDEDASSDDDSRHAVIVDILRTLSQQVGSLQKAHGSLQKAVARLQPAPKSAMSPPPPPPPLPPPPLPLQLDETAAQRKLRLQRERRAIHGRRVRSHGIRCEAASDSTIIELSSDED